VSNNAVTKTAVSLTQKEIAAYRRAALLAKPKRRGSAKARRDLAWRVARKIEPSINIDLIAFEDARPGLQRVIVKEGREL